MDARSCDHYHAISEGVCELHKWAHGVHFTAWKNVTYVTLIWVFSPREVCQNSHPRPGNLAAALPSHPAPASSPFPDNGLRPLVKTPTPMRTTARVVHSSLARLN